MAHANPPFGKKTVSRCDAGHPSVESYPLRLGQATWLVPLRASQLRDSAGFQPDFALALGETPAVRVTGSIPDLLYTPQMDTKRLTVLLAAVAAVVGTLLARNRPVKPPAHHGDWKPRPP